MYHRIDPFDSFIESPFLFSAFDGRSVTHFAHIIYYDILEFTLLPKQ